LASSSFRQTLSRIYHRTKNIGFNYVPGDDLDSFLKKIDLYFKLLPWKRERYEKELGFLKTRANTDIKFTVIFPYDFSFKYDHTKAKAWKDEKSGLYYVMHNGKKLYYSRQFDSEEVVRYMYTSICHEQDIQSPHRYLTDDFCVNDGDVVIDIGAAEGNFSLDVVEKAGKVYIFETDEKWIEALELTFEPWRDKVEIINKYVSNVDDEKRVTLKKLFGGININFIKLDVEGAEEEILSSSYEILDANKDLKLAVCTYHADRDEMLLGKIMAENGFDYRASDGYMLFIYGHLKPPYFRKALLRAQRTKN
jgi:hypothetical protein